MNQNSWEAVQRSSTFGIELHDQFYDKLRATTRAALDAEGLTLENLAAAHNIVDANETEQRRFKEERDAAAKAEKIANSLFLTAATGLLPRVENFMDYTDGLRDGVRFKTTDRQEAYDILDSIIWFNDRPYWVLGYRYTNNSALFMEAAPRREYFTSQLQRMFETSGYIYRGLTQPFRDEISYHASGYYSLDKNVGLSLGKIPINMRFAIGASQAYIYQPGRKDRKTFKKFATSEARLETMEKVEKVYNHTDKAFVIGPSTPKVFHSQDQNSNLKGCESSLPNMVSTELLNHYNVFDGLVRLMSRFNMGTEYRALMQQAKDGNIETAVMEQQGIPLLPSRAAVEDYLGNMYKRRYGER